MRPADILSALVPLLNVRLTRFLADGLSHLMLFSKCTRRFTPMTFIERLALSASSSTITFRVFVAFDELRGTKLAELLSCVLRLRDDRCAAVQPLSAAVDPVTVGSRRVGLHPTLLNCSSRSSDVAIEFSRTCSKQSASLHHSLDPPASLSSHRTHVTASTPVLVYL